MPAACTSGAKSVSCGSELFRGLPCKELGKDHVILLLGQSEYVKLFTNP